MNELNFSANYSLPPNTEIFMGDVVKNVCDAYHLTIVRFILLLAVCLLVIDAFDLFNFPELISHWVIESAKLMNGFGIMVLSFYIYFDQNTSKPYKIAFISLGIVLIAVLILRSYQYFKNKKND